MLTQATHLSQHKQTQPITRWVIRYEPPKDGASQQHTVLTHPTQTQPQASHPGCGSCQSKQEPPKRCPTDVPYSTLNGVGATNHNTLLVSPASRFFFFFFLVKGVEKKKASGDFSQVFVGLSQNVGTANQITSVS